jgi:hypothetical protein
MSTDVSGNIAPGGEERGIDPPNREDHWPVPDPPLAHRVDRWPTRTDDEIDQALGTLGQMQERPTLALVDRTRPGMYFCDGSGVIFMVVPEGDHGRLGGRTEDRLAVMARGLHPLTRATFAAWCETVLDYLEEE